MTVTVNNPAWGRVLQLSASFSYSASRPPDNVYRAISSTASGLVTLYKATPNQGYQFVRWENITARVSGSWTTHYPATQSSPAYDKSGEWDYIRKAKNTTANPIGYDSYDAALWNGDMYAPPTWESFGHRDGYDNASNIGMSSSCSSQCQNVFEGEPYVTGSDNVTWSPQTLTAVFAPAGTVKYSVVTSASPQSAGYTYGDGTYSSGETCTITATANEGWEFSYWSNGTTTVNTPSHTFTVSSNSTWTAYFVRRVSVTVRVRGESVGGLMTYHGSVSLNGGAASRPSTTAYFRSGDSISINAIPDDGYRFIKWVRLSPSPETEYNTNPKSITLSPYDELWEAVFEYVPPGDAYVSAIVSTAQVNFGDVRINSGTWLDVANATFSYQQTVTVEARATDPFYRFKNWTDGFTGNVVSTSASYSFQVYVNPGSNTSLVANFEYIGVRVRLEVDGGNGGTVRFGSLNVTSREMYVGESDTIVATPSEGWAFVKWKRESSDYSTDATTTISVSSPTPATVTYTAVFERVAYNVTLFANPQNLGYVAYAHPDPSDPEQYIVSDWARTHTFLLPVSVANKLEIYADPTSTFVSWEFREMSSWQYYYLSSDPYILVVVQDDAAIRANFQNAPTYTVTANVSPEGGGSISGLSNPYHLGDPCSLTATPADGYMFGRWEDANGNPLSSNANYSFNVQGDTTVVAVFVPIPVYYTVTTSSSPEYSGTTTGAGQYLKDSSCTVSASPIDGFKFVGWLIGGTPVSSNPTYSFTVVSDTDLVAQFSEIPPEPPHPPRDPTHRLIYNPDQSSYLVYDPATNRLLADYYATSPP